MLSNIKQRLETIINTIDELPSIPEVASKIINMANNPDVSVKQFAEEILKNQAMTTSILKLSNSAFFSKGKEISSVERAIVTLGLKEVKNIVLVITAKPVLEKAVIGYDLAPGDLWRQGLVVAALSRDIAIAKKRKDIADVVFTGGIIHNIGKVVIALYVQSAFSTIMEMVTAKGIPFHLAEREVMGYSHHELGEKILEKWNFPPVLRAIVRYYQDIGSAPEEYLTEVSIVHISNVIALMAGIGIGSDGLYHEIDDRAMKRSGLSAKNIEYLYSRVPEISKKIQELI